MIAKVNRFSGILWFVFFSLVLGSILLSMEGNTCFSCVSGFNHFAECETYCYTFGEECCGDHLASSRCETYGDDKVCLGYYFEYCMPIGGDPPGIHRMTIVETQYECWACEEW